jgi:hypothetical protein
VGGPRGRALIFLKTTGLLLPMMDDNLKRVEEALSASLGDLDALGRIVADFMHSGAGAAVLRGALERCLIDYRDKVLASLGGDSFILVRDPRFTLYMKLLPARADFLHTAGTDRVTVHWPPEAVTIDRYRIEGDYDPEIFRADARLLPEGSRPADGSALIERRGEPWVHGVRCSAPALSLSINVEPASSQVWKFDPVSLKAAFPSLSQNEHSGFVLFSKMAAAIGAPSALPILAELCGHESHAIRWAAVQAMARLDGDAARHRLRDLAQDRHPEVRESARRVLARIEA